MNDWRHNWKADRQWEPKWSEDQRQDGYAGWLDDVMERAAADALHPEPSAPDPMSPRQALANFYPEWSPDGRFIAYTSERRADGPRELWVYDTTTRREERVPAEQKLGRPFGCSPDTRRILAAGQNDGRLFTVDRVSGDTRLVSKTSRRARWLPEGIVFIQ